MNTIGSKRPRDRISQKYLWHLRLGHIREDRLNKLKKDGLLGPLSFESYLVYELCLQEKMIKIPFVRQGERVTEILALVYTDVCGPFYVQGRGDYIYFINFTDDYSRYGFVYLIHQKSEVFEKFIEFRHEVKK